MSIAHKNPSIQRIPIPIHQSTSEEPLNLLETAKTSKIHPRPHVNLNLPEIQVHHDQNRLNLQTSVNLGKQDHPTPRVDLAPLELEPETFLIEQAPELLDGRDTQDQHHAKEVHISI